MRNLFCLLFGLFLWIFSAYGQQSIEVADQTFCIKKHEDKIFLFGMAAGDKMVLSVKMEKGGKMDEVEVAELKASSRYLESQVKRIKNKTIEVSVTGIYSFRFTNNSDDDKTCRFQLSRIPQSGSTRKFNTSVYWRTVQDTTYVPVQPTQLIRKDTAAQVLVERMVKVPAASVINKGANKATLDFTLPAGTVSWSYYIGVGREGEKAYAQAKSGFLNSAASTAAHFWGYGTMAALALYGVNAFSLIQGDDNVKFGFVTSEDQLKLFVQDKKWNAIKSGDVLNDAGQMKTPLSGKVYLGLMNDNWFEAINVRVSVTAVTISEKNVSPGRIMKISSREEAYLKDE